MIDLIFKNLEEMHVFGNKTLKKCIKWQYRILKKSIFYAITVYIQEDSMYFERKAYNSLLEWKKHYSGQYAVLLEGARRVANLRLQRILRKMNISHIF